MARLSNSKPGGGRIERMPHYIAVIHKDETSCYGVSFPELPGIITAGETIDDAMHQAADVLAFAAEDWEQTCGTGFPEPSSLEALRANQQFVEMSRDAVLALIPLSTDLRRAA